MSAARLSACVTDPIAQALLRGVSTRGTTANGLPATYGATDVHAVTDATATWDGSDLGALGPVSPPVRFGFGSTPPEPSLTALTTTIEVPEPDPLTGVIDCWGVGPLRDKQAREQDEESEVSQEARAARAEGAEGQLPTPLSDAKREEFILASDVLGLSMLVVQMNHRLDPATPG